MRSAAHKHRDIARSILPSTSRRAAHDLAATRRHHRRAVRADLRALRRVDHDDIAIDLTRTADREINQIRRYRRGADKLNHFERWAVRVTRDMPVEDRMSWLRSVLPGGLIGDHAMSHLRWIDELQAHEDHSRLPRWVDRRAENDERQRARRARLRADLRRALEEPGGHRAINLALRSVESEDDDDGPRLLGVHGVDALVDVLIADPDRPRTRYESPGADHPAAKAVARAVRRREGSAPPSGGGAA
jgi:hypothetical protein